MASTEEYRLVVILYAYFLILTFLEQNCFEQQRIQRYAAKSPTISRTVRSNNVNALFKAIKDMKGMRAYNAVEKLLKSNVVDVNATDLSKLILCYNIISTF